MSDVEWRERVAVLEKGQESIVNSVEKLTERLFGADGEIPRLRKDVRDFMRFQFLLTGAGLLFTFAVKAGILGR